MDTKHLTMIGLGVAGVGTLLTVMYMRNASAAAAAAANNSGSTPYFQTAALPSSVTGSSDTSTSAGSSSPSLDIAGLISSITAGQTASTTSNTQLGFAADATGLMDSISKLLINSTQGNSADAWNAGVSAEAAGAQRVISANGLSGDLVSSLSSSLSSVTSEVTGNVDGNGGPSFPGLGSSLSSFASRLIGTISIGGLDANVNLIADHPNSAGLYLNTPPMAFVNDPNAPVGGSSSQNGVVLGNTTATPANTSTTQAAA